MTTNTTNPTPPNTLRPDIREQFKESVKAVLRQGFYAMMPGSSGVCSYFNPATNGSCVAGHWLRLRGADLNVLPLRTARFTHLYKVRSKNSDLPPLEDFEVEVMGAMQSIHDRAQQLRYSDAAVYTVNIESLRSIAQAGAERFSSDPVSREAFSIYLEAINEHS